MKTKTSLKTLQMVQTAILAAILIVMAFTPLGYFNLGPVSITFLMIPVVIGAIVVGPAAGAFLGLVFGLSSFIKAFSDPLFGSILLNINWMYTLILCLVPRTLMGLLVGFIFRALSKIDKTKIVSFIISSASGALLNTALFLTGLILFFGNHPFITQFGSTPIVIFVTLAGVNALIEAVICTVVGTAIAKALRKYLIDPKEPKAPAAAGE